MQINSIHFLLFFIIVFVLYYFPLKEKTRAQNILIVLASYVFYGIANWKMIPLLLLATGIFYGLGFFIGRSNETNPPKAFLLTTFGVCAGIGILLYFKYLNFFISSFSGLFSAIGLHSNLHTFNIIMPIGVSFFTFKLISYLLEIQRRRIKPSSGIIAFAAYIAFFPTIMAGPIDRPNTFIPQLQTKRVFDYSLVVDGCLQILWGMFKKMVIADNIATVVDMAWNNIASTPGSALLVVAFLYTIQLYADFSGYSDMAIGVGKIVGLRIARNFNYPFFGRNTAEFWRNWHISLTSWLTDYVFMPLNIRFRDAGKWGMICAIIINFVLVGLWHGANWTFAVFGLYHGLLYIPLILSGAFAKKNKLILNKLGLPALKDFAGMFVTFILVTIGNIIFRAEHIAQVWDFIQRIGSGFFPLLIRDIPEKKMILAAIALLVVEWYGRKGEYAISGISGKLNPFFRVIFYSLLFLGICFFRNTGESIEFIYFQF
jgi:D-alanyl-lipoteichoic acid acyltransferase DltB (MBOAT superfamily)